MKQARKFSQITVLALSVIFAVCCLSVLTSCAEDPYKDYSSTGIEALPVQEGNEFGYNKVEIFTDYAAYSEMNFNLDYGETFFKTNNLLVCAVSCCSSDEMEFGQILENDGKLYPLFYRKRIGKNQPVTDDFIVISFCAEVPKSAGYSVGNIIYRYK